jgi:hypothetical protein
MHPVLFGNKSHSSSPSSLAPGWPFKVVGAESSLGGINAPKVFVDDALLSFYVQFFPSIVEEFFACRVPAFHLRLVMGEGLVYIITNHAYSLQVCEILKDR